MLKASPTKWGYFCWQMFCKYSIKFFFNDLICEGDMEIANDKSLLFIGNHISWWDGFWPIELNRQHFGKNYHVMMLEKELEPRQFMRKGGAYSIRPGHRSIVETLNYTVDLLKDPENMVLMYPQGKIHSIYDTDFSFEPGIEKILQRAGDQVQIVFFSTLIDYHSNPRPTVFVRLKEFLYEGKISRTDLSEAYSVHYQESLEKQKSLILSEKPVTDRW